MTYALLLALGFVLGAVAMYLLMRESGKSSDIVAEAKTEADEIDTAAEAELDKKLAVAKKDRAELERINKIKDKRKRFEAKADFANRNHPKRESDR